MLDQRQIAAGGRAGGRKVLPWLEASGTYAGHGPRGLDSASAREQETYRVQPDELRALGTGGCYVIHHGAAARVSVGLPAGAFGVYPVPAWLDQHRQGQSQLRPPVEPGQVRKPATGQQP